MFHSNYELEQELWMQVFRIANNLFYKSILDFTGLVAFTYIKRMELLNLLRVVDCLRYAMTAEDIVDTMLRFDK